MVKFAKNRLFNRYNVYFSFFFILVIDSFGKPPSGISQGALSWNGDYNECLESFNASLNYHSKYCRLADPNDPVDVTKPPVSNKAYKFVLVNVFLILPFFAVYIYKGPACGRLHAEKL